MVRWDISLFGSGGQGIIRGGQILSEAAVLEEGKDATLTIAYGPEQVGGWSRADVVISDEPIDFPLVTKPDVLVAMSQEGLDRSWKEGRVPKKLLIYDSELVNVSKIGGIKMVGLPATKIAEQLGRRVIANIVMLGALSEVTDIVRRESLLNVIRRKFPKALELNERAFMEGVKHAKEGATTV
ncbi:MAG: 2-oxoacid:acceptor oxidoreductase family protein [Nitrososphaerota archaeon]